MQTRGRCAAQLQRWLHRLRQRLLQSSALRSREVRRSPGDLTAVGQPHAVEFFTFDRESIVTADCPRQTSTKYWRSSLLKIPTLPTRPTKTSTQNSACNPPSAVLRSPTPSGTGLDSLCSPKAAATTTPTQAVMKQSIRTVSSFVVLLWSCAANAAVVVSPTRISSSVGSLTLSEARDKVANAFGSDTTGTKIWDAGRLLSTVMSERDLSGMRVLECGSGTGVGGLSAATAGAASVVLTDGASATMPLLAENVEANGLTERVQTCRLRWGDEDDMARAAAMGPFDLIIGSDLLYAPEVFPDLLETLTELCTPGATEVLLTYPTRQTEGIFMSMAVDEYGFEELDWVEEMEPSLWKARLQLSA